RARDVLKVWAERFHKEGYFCDSAYAAGVEAARASLAKLLGASRHQVAFFANTSHAVCQVAFGLRLSPADEVITLAGEYGANLYPWREACARSGAKLLELAHGPAGSVSADALIQASNARTK